MAKALPKSIKDLTNWKNHELFFKEMEKNANPRKWRKIHEGWVGNKSIQFPSLASFTLSIENNNKVESVVKCYILILDGQKVVKIDPELEINHS